MTDKCKTFVARWDHAVCSTCSEEHDRPAITPTPDPLATVRAALDVASKATPGEWKCDPVDVFGAPTEWSVLVGPRRPGSDWPRKSDLRHEDAVAIVAMHNAAPAIAELCAEVERLRAERDSARDSMATAHVTAAQVGDELIATRAKLAEAAQRDGFRVYFPRLEFCTDNGAMIALAAAMRLQRGLARPQAEPAFSVRPRWPLAEVSQPA